MTTYHIADTETTKLEFGAEIIELAWIEIDSNLNVISEFEQRYCPRGEISPSATEAHGIRKEDLIGCPPPTEVPSLLDVTIIAHNSRFDVRMLERFWDISREVCTCRAAQQLFPEAPDHKLQTLKDFLCLRQDQAAHSAMGDIRVLFDLLKHMLEITGLGLEDFITEANRPVKYEVMPFGKHKGMPINLLPHRYKVWLASLDDPWGDWQLTLGERYFNEQ